MSLSDAKLKALKPKAKPYKTADRAGLYVVTTPTAGKLWRYDYAYGGKRRTLSIGRWPAVSLHDARDRRDAAQALLAKGDDPCAAKAEDKRKVAARIEAETFEEAAKRWHAINAHRWSAKYGKAILTRLGADVFPYMGKKRFTDITRALILETLRRVEARKAHEACLRLRMYIGQIYRFVGAEDESVMDPTPMLRGALAPQPTVQHHHAMPEKELGEFLLKLDDYEGEPETRMAIKLTLLTVARTSEIIEAEWGEFELNRVGKEVWRVPAERMKAGDPHLVPLSKQAVAVLKELREATGNGRYLFPAPFGRSGHLSNNAMLFALYRMGYRGRATIHGLRRNFSTWANENGWPADDIELCLAHDERDRVRASYNAAQRLEPRRLLLQTWADHLDKARARAASKARLGV